MPPGTGEVPSTAVPLLTTLDPGLAAALAPGCLVGQVTLRVVCTLYDGLCPAALFDMLGGQAEGSHVGSGARCGMRGREGSY